MPKLSELTLTTLLCFVVSLQSFGQKSDTTYYNAQSQEVSVEKALYYKVFSYDKKGKRVLKEQAYSLSDELVQEINYVKGNKSGEYIYRSTESKTELIGEFKKDKKVGTWYTNDLNGNNMFYDVYSAPDQLEGRYSEKPYLGENTDLENTEGVVIIEPNYPGGMNEWNFFLSENLSYPKEASRSKTEGIVGIKFIIKTDGSKEELHVAQSSGNQSLDKEALRVVELSKKWVPATMNGYPINRSFQLRIKFRLPN